MEQISKCLEIKTMPMLDRAAINVTKKKNKVKKQKEREKSNKLNKGNVLLFFH